MSASSKSAIENINGNVRAASGVSSRLFYKSFFKNAQSALIMLADRLKYKNHRYYTRNHGDWGPDSFEALLNRAVDATGFKTPIHGEERAWTTAYENIVPIESTDEYPPDVATSFLLSKGRAVNQFFTFELSSAQQALLVPKIRIYRVEYETEYDASTGRVVLKMGKSGNPIPKETPVEIVFDAFTNSVDIQDMLTNKKGKIPGAGIRSFDWKLKGVNPADVDANIEASLKIFFNNPGDILDPSRGKSSFLSLILFAPPLHIPESKADLNPCQNEEYIDEFFEIMAEVGWAVPPSEQTGGLFTADQVDYIREATTVMYLQLTDHKFDFRQDGSAELTANYRARFKLADARHDLLSADWAHMLEDQMSKLSEALGDAPKTKGFWAHAGAMWDNQQDAIQGFVYGAQNTQGGGRVMTGRGSDDATDKEIQRQLVDLRARKSAALQSRVQSIIQELIGRNVYSVNIPYPLLLNDVGGEVTEFDLAAGREAETKGVVLPPKVIFSALLQSKLSDEDASAAEANILAPLRKAYKASTTLIVSGPGGLYSSTAVGKNTKDYQEFLQNVTDPESTLDIGDIGDAAEDIDETILKETHAEVKYFYLGDLLEILLSTAEVSSDLHHKNLAFVTTDMQYLNTFKVMSTVRFAGAEDDKTATLPAGLHAGVDNMNFKCKFALLSSSERQRWMSTLNIANIPISVELFLDFFKRKFVNERKDAYYLGDFIADIFQNFVKPVVANNGVQGMEIAMPISFITELTTTKDEHILDPSVRLGHREPRTWIDGEEWEHQPKGFPKPTSTFAAPVSAYLEVTNPDALAPRGIFRRATSPSNRAVVKIINLQMQFSHLNGQYADNISKGIPNFIVGLDRGLVKEVKFERVDQPYLRESRTAQAKTFGAAQLRELYNCTLTLYGNTLLLPGQLIYVEPNNITFGRPSDTRSTARLLGLGGYHLVVDVSNHLAMEGWTTTVKALHVAMPAYSAQAPT